MSEKKLSRRSFLRITGATTAAALLAACAPATPAPTEAPAEEPAEEPVEADQPTGGKRKKKRLRHGRSRGKRKDRR